MAVTEGLHTNKGVTKAVARGNGTGTRGRKPIRGDRDPLTGGIQAVARVV
jgi:hypothetical protein